MFRFGDKATQGAAPPTALADPWGQPRASRPFPALLASDSIWRGACKVTNMVRSRSGAVLVVALGLLTTGCATAGLVGATAAVLVGVGALASTCYDRVEVTVIDQALGNKVCDAKVVFWEGKSATEATNCYSASLSTGTYTLKVTRTGLEPFEQKVTVDTNGRRCDSSLQTMYLAMDRAKGRIRETPAPVAAPVADAVTGTGTGTGTAPAPAAEAVTEAGTVTEAGKVSAPEAAPVAPSASPAAESAAPERAP